MNKETEAYDDVFTIEEFDIEDGFEPMVHRT